MLCRSISSSLVRVASPSSGNPSAFVSAQPLPARRHSAALDQRPEKPLLFEGVFRAQHSDLGIIREAEGDRLFEHERTAARERCAQAMH
jgi:hypothetical protein